MIGQSVNILLVEDDDIDAETVTRAFEKNKIANSLRRAHDGIEALEILRGENGHPSIPSPHLLLVDINMPRMNGIELLKEIRACDKLHKTIAFVLTTSKSDEDIFQAYDLNVAGYVVKSNVGENFIEMLSMLDHYWRVVEFP